MRGPRGLERCQHRAELQQSDAQRLEDAVDGPAHQFARQWNVPVHPVFRTGDLAVRLWQDVRRSALEQRDLARTLGHMRHELNGAGPGTDDTDMTAGQIM